VGHQATDKQLGVLLRRISIENTMEAMKININAVTSFTGQFYFFKLFYLPPG
jgi:hypothetical protein